MICSSAECASESSTASRSSSTNESDSSTNGTPRKMISGGATERPSCSEIGRDHDEDAVRGQHAAVAERHVLDVAHLHAVHEDQARLLALAEAGARRVDLERQAVLAAEDRLRRHAHRLGQLPVKPQPLVVAVHRHHVARVGEVDHQLQLLGVAVTRGVDGHVARW